MLGLHFGTHSNFLHSNGGVYHSRFFGEDWNKHSLHNTLSLRGAIGDEFGVFLVRDDYTPKQSSCSNFASNSEQEDCLVTSPLQNLVNTNTFQTHIKNVPRNDEKISVRCVLHFRSNFVQRITTSQRQTDLFNYIPILSRKES
jgi:hypothetical protein